VSLLLPDEFHIVLYPERFVLSHIRRDFTYRGVVRRELTNQIIPAPRGAEAPWEGALEMLETALADAARSRSRATLILSNQLVRYALVPWSGALSDEEEEIAVARHCFRNLYGEVADTWELRLSPGKAGTTQLASAVDGHLPDALRELFGRLGMRIASIQPQLMAAYNANRSRLRGRNAWFVLQEPGNLCVARLHKGCWVSLRTLRVGSAWREELPVILEREAYLADSAALPEEVWLCATESPDGAQPLRERWKLERLQWSLPAELAPRAGESLALAMN